MLNDERTNTEKPMREFLLLLFVKGQKKNIYIYIYIYKSIHSLNSLFYEYNF
jgi:hypothetical protein